MKEEKKKKKSGVLTKIIVSTLLVAGAGFLAYRYIPGVKGKIDEILPKKKDNKYSIKFETKPKRRYETYSTK